MRLATLTASDLDAALDLWAATEHVAPVPRHEVTALLERGEQLVVGAFDDATLDDATLDDATLVGVVIGTYDGRRGWIQRLAVDPDVRGRGVGRALVAEVERRLAALGCTRINLMTFADNDQGQRFWAQLGYHASVEVVLFHRELSSPGAVACDEAPRGPAC